MPAGAFLLYLLGKLTPVPIRVLHYVLIIGIFGFVPLQVALLLPILSLLFLPPAASKLELMLCAAFLVPSAFWIFSEVSALRSILGKSRYVEREFRVEKEAIFANREPRTKLDEKRALNGSGTGKIGRWFVPKLVMVAAIGYPLQKMLTAHAGIPSTVLLLAVICTPFALYVTCRMACEAYLWIYTVWKLERNHKKHVLLSEKNDPRAT